MRVPIPAPRRLKTILIAGWMHLREMFERPGTLTPPYECSEFFHVCKSLADGGEPTVKAGTFDLRFRNSRKTALIKTALEPEFPRQHG
jgi:hypothetical protein